MIEKSMCVGSIFTLKGHLNCKRRIDKKKFKINKIKVRELKIHSHSSPRPTHPFPKNDVEMQFSLMYPL